MTPVKLIVLIIIVITTFLGCSTNGDEYMQTSTESKTYLALGDSYTIGESVQVNERWPKQLADSLKFAGINLDSVEIIAKTGWTTDELNNAINVQSPNSNFDIVSLLIGVNNQYRGRSVDEFRIQFRELLQRAITFADNKKENVFVLSIPDWGVTPFATGRDKDKIFKEIDMFNNVKEEECKQVDVKFFNITDISREAEDDRSLIAQDGLHPSGKMYSQWVSRILPEIIIMLEN
jgi:lysophospholipase L1-like esterase